MRISKRKKDGRNGRQQIYETHSTFAAMEANNLSRSWTVGSGLKMTFFKRREKKIGHRNDPVEKEKLKMKEKPLK